MSLTSMTGHGRGNASAHGLCVEVELSSVNRKQFDLRLSLPRSLSVLESRVQQLAHKRISRGCISAAIRVSLNGGTGVRVNRVHRDRAAAYMRQIRTLAGELGIPPEVSMDTLLALPGVADEPCAVADNAEEVWPLLERALKEALTGMLSMRKAEGEALAKDLARRFMRLRRKHAQILKVAPSVARRHKQAMLKRLREMQLEMPPNDPQLLREIAIFADRSDISEELVRLASHFDQADGLMASSKPVGRSFDFLCQEMLREINTIGSKANDGRLSKLVIEFKSELERVREQVQNVE